MKLPTREQLEKRRTTTIADLQSKMEAEDWHGVADAAMDLREIDVALKYTRPVSESEQRIRDFNRELDAAYPEHLKSHA